ncbi:MAG: DUF1109 family protein [Rhodospirillales bacterium]|nr:DUF1109 family protein [Rhodospirillales bacterium]
MILDTRQLIQRLADDGAPVRRLPHPMTRAAAWLVISIPYVAALALIYRLSGVAITQVLDVRFLIEQLAMIVTAITAAIAAFCCIVPGRDRRIALLPLVPLAAWLASLAEACLSSWLRSGSFSLGLPVDWAYFPRFALIGLVPAVLMIVMLRRGAPLYPRSTLMLGALAVAALGNVGLRLFHAGNVTLTMLLCTFATIALLSALAAWVAPHILSWRHVIVHRENVA